MHKLRNLERKAPKHALAELREDFHRIVCAASGESARAVYAAFERKWGTRCPGVARSLAEGPGRIDTRDLSATSRPRARVGIKRCTR